MTTSYITAWDIGGAHLKVAQCTTTGQIVDVFELPCPLWQGLQYLSDAIQSAEQRLSPSTKHAVTMTGELVDLFPHRQAGVSAILNCFTQHFPTQQCHIYAGQQQWLTPDQAQQAWSQVASQNWQASVTYAAQQIQNGLFIDVGSTTSDIIAIKQFSAQPKGFTDFDRQISQELFYAGAIRTPLIAMAHHAPFQGHTVSLAAEYFATTGDCWVLSEKIQPDQIKDKSADGQPWQQEHCAQRIARLLGTDACHYPLADWQQLAQWFNQQQIHRLRQACQAVIQQHPELPASAPLIGAGIGRFMVKQCAQALARDYIDFDTLLTTPHPQAADHAPAVAIALLACRNIS